MNILKSRLASRMFLARMSAQRVIVAAMLLTSAGCEHALSPYRGPQPERASLDTEAVTVRYVNSPVAGQHSFIVDRDKYVEARNSHNVNRVVMLFTTPETVDAVTALDLQRGDRIVVSTEFVQIRKVGDLREIPNWPGHRYLEYPIGVHRFIDIARAP